MSEARDTSAPTLSIVVPCFNEERAVSPFLAAIENVGSRLPSFEVIFVDDGSTDATLEAIRRRGAECSFPVRLVRLSRNFGHQLALLAGMRATRGAAVVTIDVDLQDPPELLPEFVSKWREGFSVVIGQRNDRSSDGWIKRITADGFYWVLRTLTRTPFPQHAGDFRLVDRRVVELMMETREIQPYWRGLAVWVGFPRTLVPYRRGARTAGETHYPMSKMIAFALDAMFAFSRKPLQVASYLGLLVSIASLGLVAVYVFLSVTGRKEFVPGWVSTVMFVGFLGGCQLMSIGILGEYVGRIYELALQRPNVIVEGSEWVSVPSTASTSKSSPS